MRLALVVVFIITLILISRWYALTSQDKEATDARASVLASSELTALGPSKFESRNGVEQELAPKTGDVLLAHFQIADQPNHRDGNSAASSQGSNSSLGSNAKNIQSLVRAEYELPKEEALTLMNLKPFVVLEIEQIEAEDSARVILQVTTDAKTQHAFSKFLIALYPADASAIAKSRLQMQPVESELAAQ